MTTTIESTTSKLDLNADNKSDIVFNLYGDPEMYNSDDDETDKKTDDGKKKMYKLNKLPGKTLYIEIKCGLLVWRMLATSAFKDDDVKKLVAAQSKNEKYCVSWRPGSNQDCWIQTLNGYTSFDQCGAGGDCPTDTKIRIPNECCIEQFRKLIN
jgi:hypothetical protein